MNVDMKTVFDTFLFDNVDTDILCEETKNIQIQTYSGGETVCKQGEEKSIVGIVLSGTVEIRRGSAPINLLKKGGVFGAASVFGNGVFLSTVTAKGKTRIAIIDKDTMKRFIEKSSVFTMNFLKFLSNRVEFLNSSIECCTLLNSEDKVYKYFCENKDAHGVLVLPITLSALAERIGIGRASLYRVIDSLEEKKLIKKNSKNEFFVYEKEKK